MDEDNLTPSESVTRNDINEFASSHLGNYAEADHDVITNETPTGDDIAEILNKKYDILEELTIM